MVFVATEHDSVYAFDADGLATAPLWQKSFIDPANGITTVDSLNDVQCDNLVPEIGITGTPVISIANQALYVVSETKDQNTSTYAMELHALDLTTGAEKFGGPVPISAMSTAKAVGNDGKGQVSFVPNLALQRAGAAARKRHGLHCLRLELRPRQLSRMGAGLRWAHARSKGGFNTTPNGSEGGIWQSGNGPSASPSGNMFVGIGNGTFEHNSDYGDSFVKLNPMLRVLDYFTPSGQA